MDHVGPQCFMWATDYPHPDHPGTGVGSLSRQVAGLSDATRRRFLGDNVRAIYGLTA
jgi:predicted TIM-barrel fold metal-dependent hydrolase